jgi:phosphoglycolate phosphatase-like HAD superfamily hydrolase
VKRFHSGLRVITDFDGPVMNLSERYYQVYRFCLAQFNGGKLPEPSLKISSTLRTSSHRSPARPTLKPLSKEAFWQLKRAQTPEQDIGLLSGLSPQQALEFAQCRARHAHTHPYFDYDTLVPGAVAALERLHQSGADVAVMTLRRESELDYALKQHNLGHLFHPERRFCLKDDYLKTGDVDDKTALMTQAMEQLSACEQTWMVGDTEADMTAAHSQNIPVIAVLSGIRDLAQIHLYEPDWIVPDLAAAVQMILQQAS